MKPETIQKLLQKTKLLRKPKRLLSTFGATRIEYHLVSPVEDLPNKSRLREGLVVSEKPQILTPESLKERFHGFGEDAREFSEWLQGEYRDVLRALEYTFKNQHPQTTVITENAHKTALKIRDDVNKRDISHAAVIECPDAGWALALMRFTLEHAAHSFPTNVNDLDRRGMFDQDAREEKRARHEVEQLFEQAKADSQTRQRLGAKLREYGLFEEYEDRFLALFQ